MSESVCPSKESSVCDEFALYADICNLGSGFLATDYMSFFKVQELEAITWEPNRLSHILKSFMITVLFVNVTIVFSENLFLVYIVLSSYP